MRSWGSKLFGTAVVVTLLAGCGGGGSGAASESASALPPAPRSKLVDVFEKLPPGGLMLIDYLDLRTARPLMARDKELYAFPPYYYIHDMYDFRHPAESGNDSLVIKPTAKETYGYDETDVDTAVSYETDGNYLTGRFDKKAIAASSSMGAGLDSLTDSVIYRVMSAPKGKTLADDPSYVAVANCLGTVFTANFDRKYARNSRALLAAVGTRMGTDGKPVSKLCALSGSRKDADELAGMLRAFTAKGKPFEGATVAVEERDKPMVMMSWKNQARPGLRVGQHRLLGYGKWGDARNQPDFTMTNDSV
ncbi:hypothetical protein ABZ471_47210 [Streptomyces sp. NPDC005728]|uniref:hypothetical protein n=1 Tax=Streptomyces sp. NPDC005728 TaxID=3157054 RepID=UPI0033EACA52